MIATYFQDYQDWHSAKVRVTTSVDVERDSNETTSTITVDAFAIGLGWYSVLSETARNLDTPTFFDWKDKQLTYARWLLEAPE